MSTSLFAASEPKLDSVSGDWNVFSLPDAAQKTCYIASAPKKKAGNVAKRGDPYILITHRGAKVDEISVSTGYEFKAGSEVTLEVNGKPTKLFTKSDLAWAYSPESDAALVKAMLKGSKLSVKGISQQDTASADSYSLGGISKAYKRMKALCK